MVAIRCRRCSDPFRIREDDVEKSPLCPSCRLASRRESYRQENLATLRTAQACPTLFPFVAFLACASDSACCEYCHGQHGRRIATLECTDAMVPPFRLCTNKVAGCRCVLKAVDRYALEDAVCAENA
jgi:hypothetical protein